MKLMSLLMLLALPLCGLRAQAAPPQQTLALVLRFDGHDGVATRVSVRSAKLFNGRTRPLRKRPDAGNGESLVLRFYSETGALLYSEQVQSPLVQPLEAYGADGKMEHGSAQSNTGYVNLRVPATDAGGVVRMTCHRLGGDRAETLLSTLNIPVR